MPLVVDSLPGLFEVYAATQPKDAETAETVDLVREALELERQPGGLLYDDGSTFELKSIRQPLKAYVFARQNPAAAAGVPIAGALALVGVGWLIGRYWRKK